MSTMRFLGEISNIVCIKVIKSPDYMLHLSCARCKNLIKGDMTRYLLMSINLGIWNIKHDFI